MIGEKACSSGAAASNFFSDQPGMIWTYFAITQALRSLTQPAR